MINLGDIVTAARDIIKGRLPGRNTKGYTIERSCVVLNESEPDRKMEAYLKDLSDDVTRRDGAEGDGIPSPSLEDRVKGIETDLVSES